MYNANIMAKRQRKAGEPECNILRDIVRACMDEKAAVEFMEKQRWEDEPYCPHCGCLDNVYKMTDAKTGERNKRWLWRCRDCKKQFTVRIGTVFEESRIPLRHWCFAFWAACASKKGVSALQISRQCSLSYKSALFLMHRIRWAMADPEPSTPLSETVEVDETYVGGKPRGGKKNKRGRGTKKTPVIGMVQRKGNVRARVITDVTTKTLRGEIEKYVDPTAQLYTDELRSYRSLRYTWPGGHNAVRHSTAEYVRGDVFTNTAESFFAIVKRGMYGVFHAVSKRHLPRYVSEFEFRWNTRKLSDGERIAQAINQAQGKRLLYHQPAG